jgi:hypothetical protein
MRRGMSSQNHPKSRLRQRIEHVGSFLGATSNPWGIPYIACGPVRVSDNGGGFFSPPRLKSERTLSEAREIIELAPRLQSLLRCISCFLPCDAAAEWKEPVDAKPLHRDSGFCNQTPPIRGRKGASHRYLFVMLDHGAGSGKARRITDKEKRQEMALKTTGGQPMRLALRPTVTSTRLAMRMNGMPLFIP